MPNYHPKVLLYEQAMNEIINLIRGENLKLGDKLPPERELAARLGKSRSCIREALQALAADGVLKIKRSSGIYLNTDNACLPQTQFFTEQKQVLKRILQLLEARFLLELHCAKETAKCITQNQLLELCRIEEETYADLLAMTLQSGSPYGKATIVFEHRVVSIQPNEILTGMHRRVCQQWQEIMDDNKLVVMPPARRHKDHIALLSAIREKNDRKIEKAIVNHLGEVSAIIKQMLQKETNP